VYCLETIGASSGEFSGATVVLSLASPKGRPMGINP
jgi:hypothetical protein